MKKYFITISLKEIDGSKDKLLNARAIYRTKDPLVAQQNYDDIINYLRREHGFSLDNCYE